VLALSRKNCFVTVNSLPFDYKFYIRKSLVVDQGSEIADEIGYRLVVNLVLFQFADVEDANVVQPLAAVKSAENKELLCADNAGGVSLPA